MLQELRVCKGNEFNFIISIREMRSKTIIRIYFLLKISFMVVPSLAGDSATTTPASFSALILSSAPPFPPEMIAPA